MTTSKSEPVRIRIESSDGDSAIGTVLSGSVVAGDDLTALPGGAPVSITGVKVAGAQIELGIKSEEELQSGQILVSKIDRPEVTDQFEANMHWVGEDPMLPGRQYEFRSATACVDGSITRLKFLFARDDTDQLAASTLHKGEQGRVNLALSREIVFDPFDVNPATARFELFDTESNAQVAKGAILHGLRRASNVHWQAMSVNKEARANLKGQTPKVLWFTGLSASGKSTIANVVEKRLLAAGKHAYLLDGDNIRHGLNKDLGFTEADRVENIRRVSETARLMIDAGLIVLTSFISPFRSEREMARSMFGDDEFVEIFVDTPIELCEQRDPKGLYKKARSGTIKNFTGFDSPYEEPKNPELRLATADLEVEEAASKVLSYLGIDA